MTSPHNARSSNESPWADLDWRATLAASAELDTRLALLPGDARPRLLGQAGKVADRLARYGLTGPSSLMPGSPLATVDIQRNRSILTSAITAAADDEEEGPRNALFSEYRNAAISVIGLAAIQHGRDLTDLLRQFPAVKKRNSDKTRPLTHDEAAAARIGAWHSLQQPNTKGRQRGVYYILSEIGARPSETTHITDLSFDSADRPRLLTVPGLRIGASPRQLPLDQFQRTAARVAISKTRARNPAGTRLAYRGDLTSNKELCAAASGPIKQFLRSIGLSDPMLTASSVCKYRAAALATAGDVDIALHLVGAKDRDNALRRLQYKHNTADLIDQLIEDEDFDWDDAA